MLLDLVRVPPDGSRASLYQAASALLQHLGDDADAAWIEAVAKGGRAVVSGGIAGVSEGSGALPVPSTPVTMNPLHAAVVCVSRWPDKPWLYRSIKAEEPGSIESLPPVRRHLHDCLASPSASCSTPPDEMLHTGTLQSGGGKVKGTIISITHAHTHTHCLLADTMSNCRPTSAAGLGCAGSAVWPAQLPCVRHQHWTAANWRADACVQALVRISAALVRICGTASWRALPCMSHMSHATNVCTAVIAAAEAYWLSTPPRTCALSPMPSIQRLWRL